MNRVVRAAVAGAWGAALLGALACGASPAAEKRPVVVAAFYPLAEIAARAGGGEVKVINLTPAAAEPHDLELRPGDAATLRRAALVLYFGRGFQPAVERAARSMGDRAVDLLSGLPLRRPAGSDPEQDLVVDPHVWLSPQLYERLIDGIANALAARLPGSKSVIVNRAAAYKSDIRALDEEFSRGLAHCARHEIFTSHAAFAYLADRYRLRQVPLTGVSPESEPSPRRLQEVAELARRLHATTIFFETLISPRLANTIARTVGASTRVLNPIEGLTDEQGRAGADYVSVMRENLNALKEALGCT
jgi:zinc transport system substrate-binding protein